MHHSTLEIDIQPTMAHLRRRKGSNFYRLMFGRFYPTVALLILLISTGVACKTPKTNKQDMKAKGTMATVVDYTGLDGCGKMLLLDDGRLLLPMDGAEAMNVCHYGQRVTVNFTEQEAMVSICMAEDLSASIESLDLAESVDFSWMDSIVKKTKPYNIHRCSDDDGSFIYIQTGKRATAYTLDGEEICNTPGKAMSDCVRRFSASKAVRIKGMP